MTAPTPPLTPADAAPAATAATNPEEEVIVVSDGSRAYAQLFIDARPPPDTPLAEALAQSREHCVTVARRVGGPVEPVRRIDDLTLPTIDGSGQSFAVRVYLPTLFDDEGDDDEQPPPPQPQTQPNKKLGLLLYVHGGGTMMGCIPSYDTLCRRLAARSGACVVSVGYRLAPEHPYPSGLRDVEAAYRWMVSTLATELYPGVLDPERAAVVGDSAGGHMCAALLVRLQRYVGDLPARLRPKAAVLVYPGLDFTLTAPSFQKYGACGHLNPKSMSVMLRAYLAAPGEPSRYREELLTDPEVSVLFLPQDELAATFPPTLLLSAEADPIADDAVNLAPKLEKANVPVRRVLYPNVIHGFWSGWDLFPEAAMALEEACQWLREYEVGQYI